MNWRDALRAVAVTARRRASNSVPMKSGPCDERELGRCEGKRHAYTVIADECEYLARLPSREALSQLRTWLKSAQRPRVSSARWIAEGVNQD